MPSWHHNALRKKEGTSHVLSCPHEDSINSWKKALDQLINNLENIDTCVYLRAALKLDLTAHRTGH